MHACMQFDVYLSDLHYTEKVAIYYAKLVNQRISRWSQITGMRSKIPFDPHIIIDVRFTSSKVLSRRHE